jgi:hypothetical protein
VQLSWDAAEVHAAFDDPNLVSHAGLVPLMRFAQRASLGELAAGHVAIGAKGGVNPGVKILGDRGGDGRRADG